MHWHRSGCCYKYSTLKGTKITFYLSSIESRNSNDKSPHKVQKHSYKSKQIYYFFNQGVSENNHISHTQYQMMSQQTNFLWKHGNWVSQQKRNIRDVHFGIAKVVWFFFFFNALFKQTVAVEFRFVIEFRFTIRWILNRDRENSCWFLLTRCKDALNEVPKESDPGQDCAISIPVACS